MPETLQLVAELDVVVDFAVFDQRVAPVVTPHRHVAERAEVEDAQALATERARTQAFGASSVGATMALRRTHGLERQTLRRRDVAQIEVVDARDAAHMGVFSRLRRENERRSRVCR